MDLGFPIIKYCPKKTPNDWGLEHGETFRAAIAELVEIRLELFRERKPSVKDSWIEENAMLQWQRTEEYDSLIFSELEGIRTAANLSVSDIVVLNNYTDFRDLHLPEEGCSTLSVSREKTITGFTWDMHGSAADYVSLVELPEHSGRPAARLLTVVGCCGMSGVNTHGSVVSINNLNTKNAEAAPMWPVVVRSLLSKANLPEMKSRLAQSPIGGGRSYLLADLSDAALIEVSPSCQVQVDSLTESPEIFHANHCLTKEMIAMEDKESLSSTTHSRFSLLEKNVSKVKNLADMRMLLESHEGEPKSICSHFQSNSQDPSQTCAAAAIDFNSNRAVFWRGCSKSTRPLVSHEFSPLESVDG